MVVTDFARLAGVASLLLAASTAFVASFTAVDTGRQLTRMADVSQLTNIEQQLFDNIDKDNIRDYLHAYSSTPHVCGSQQDYRTALYTAEMFESFGVSAEIKEYYTLISSPIAQSLSILEPAVHARELNLTEGTVAGDTCTTSEDVLPGSFLAYAASGNVTASVVYLNYGRQADFQYLAANNVTLKDKIALIRYGGNFRGLKVQLAEQYEMAGVLIYSDPKDDGFGKGAVYPNGTWRPEDSFQRGSLQYLSIASGDPLTPGFPSTKDADYLDINEVNSIPHIPVLALSYGQAKYILASLSGSKAPTAWQGGLTFDDGYHIGDDEATVLNLYLDIDNHITPIWDVIGTIEGEVEPDKQVIIGNHRDAWTCGAIDPNSGSSVLLELARGFGELLKQGWKPRRTITFASWDGEEFGLLGSTEYAEDQRDLLEEQAVAYINVDAFLGHLVFAHGSPAIAQFLQDTAKAVPANRFFGNETETTLYQQWFKQQTARRSAYGNLTTDGTLAPDHLVTLIGSGSDYTPFYSHLGVISANILLMNSDAVYGTYHSTMDSIMFSETIGDPEYITHVTLAKWWGLLALRMAEDEILPLDYSTYGVVMAEQLQTLETKIVAMNRSVNFTDLETAIQLFTETADEFQAQVTAFAESDNITDASLREWNEKLVRLERYLILEEGLPHRPWYKHVVFGPGFYEGYAGTSFPGIADSIAFSDDSETMQAHVDDVANAVKEAAKFLVSP